MARHTIPQTVKQAVRDKYTWPGGYPLFIVTDDGGSLHPDCAKAEWPQIAHDTVKGWKGTGWRVTGADINYEDSDLHCDHCGDRIESAYAE